MEQEKEYISEQEARTVKELFRKYLQDYKQKPADMTDKEWLVQLFQKELPETTPEQAEKDAIEITESISEFDENLASVNEAAKHGISKENWLADKIQQASVGVSVVEYGQTLQELDNHLALKNAELHDALTKKERVKS